MPWLQLNLKTTQQHAESVDEALLTLGALSITYLDAADVPILEPAPGETPLWQNLQIQALFDATIDSQAVLQQWHSFEVAAFTTQEKFELVEDKDWQRAWMYRFEPMKFGNRLWVCPSWKPVPDKTAVNIMLDPGLAFGTGTHATTALCLTWLDSIDLTGKTLIDYGCGSGILAIAALKLGAAKVYAVDIDQQAITATQENAKRNQIAQQRIQVGQPEIINNLKADLLVANILAGPLQQLAQSISSHCHTHARIALSGLLKQQTAAVKQTYQTWFNMQAARFQQNWSLLTGIKKP